MSSGSNQGYREVARRIRERIKQGVYPLGKQLPTEVELAEELGVNRVTVNRALAILRAEGWIRTHRGVGTFARDFMPIIRARSSSSNQTRRKRTGIHPAGELSETDLIYDTRIVTEHIQPAKNIADLLGVSSGEVSVLAETRYISVKNAPGERIVPYQIAVTYVPLRIEELPAQAEEGVRGHEPDDREDTIEVRPPEAEELSFLKLNEDQRVYDILQLGFSDDGRVKAVSRTAIPTHLARLRYDICD